MTHPTPDPTPDHSHGTDTVEEPQNLRFLRRLVTTLTVIMVAGLVVIISLLVIRLSADPVHFIGPELPEHISLPEGAHLRAITFGTDWIAVVTQADEILIFDSTTGELHQRVEIE